MNYDIGRLAEAKFEPFPHPADPAKTAGELSWIRDGKAQFWRGTADTLRKVAPYACARAEIRYVIEGSVDTHRPDGETSDLGEGDGGACDENIDTTCTFTSASP